VFYKAQCASSMEGKISPGRRSVRKGSSSLSAEFALLKYDIVSPTMLLALLPPLNNSSSFIEFDDMIIIEFTLSEHSGGIPISNDYAV